jgi:predicted nuclease of predicted toxin-antitoxin system
MLRFIVDTQLPPSLSDFFKKKGFDATHVVDYFLLINYPPAVLLLQLGNIKNREWFVFMENHLEAICELFAENIKRMILINHHKIVIY